jgi:hypothetical protein
MSATRKLAIPRPRCGSMVERTARAVYNPLVMAEYSIFLLWPMLAHIGLVVLLYVWLTFERTRAVWRGEAEYSAYLFGEGEPHQAARISANLSNQFELPVIFYALVVLLIAINEVLLIDVIAAWVFVAGRAIHTLVQTLTDNVPLRGKVFTINFLAVLALAGHVLLLAIGNG